MQVYDIIQDIMLNWDKMSTTCMLFCSICCVLAAIYLGLYSAYLGKGWMAGEGHVFDNCDVDSLWDTLDQNIVRTM